MTTTSAGEDTPPNLLTGLSAFPLTPVTDDPTGGIDEAAFSRLIARLAEARVDSITVLGSTGSYAYLNADERRRVIELAVAAAGDVPVIAGIGATPDPGRTPPRHAGPGSRRDRTAAGPGLLPAAHRRGGLQPLRGRRGSLLGPTRRLRQPRHHPLHLQRRPARTHRRAASCRLDQDPAGRGWPSRAQAANHGAARQHPRYRHHRHQRGLPRCCRPQRRMRHLVQRPGRHPACTVPSHRRRSSRRVRQPSNRAVRPARTAVGALLRVRQLPGRVCPGRRAPPRGAPEPAAPCPRPGPTRPHTTTGRPGQAPRERRPRHRLSAVAALCRTLVTR